MAFFNSTPRALRFVKAMSVWESQTQGMTKEERDKYADEIAREWEYYGRKAVDYKLSNMGYPPAAIITALNMYYEEACFGPFVESVKAAAEFLAEKIEEEQRLMDDGRELTPEEMEEIRKGNVG